MIGQKTIDQSRSVTAKFTVPWEPGVVTANAFENGRVMAVKELRSSPAFAFASPEFHAKLRAVRRPSEVSEVRE